MKISERKQRLRSRGVVPVSQEAGQWQKKEPSSGSARGARRTTTSTTPSGKAPRPRWQPSPGYQIAFGVAYVVFAPILFLQSWTLLNQPHSKVHPGAFEFIMPVVFFLFGLWWVYRGVQARRKARAGAVAAISTTTTERKPRRGAVSDNEARVG